MRKELKPLLENRITVKAVFSNRGWKTGYMGDSLETLLFTNVCDFAGNVLTDHIWLNSTKGFEKLDLQIGNIVIFEARVKSYSKGYKGRDIELRFEKPVTTDYKFSHPTKIKKV